jgi:uncharacterized membrane protein YoaK (UPF0700 family)
VAEYGRQSFFGLAVEREPSRAISYNTYLSFMSGNTTQTGYRIGQRDFAQAVRSALAIVFFAGGSFVVA